MSGKSKKTSLTEQAQMGPFLPAGVSATEASENYFNREARYAVEGRPSRKAAYNPS